MYMCFPELNFLAPEEMEVCPGHIYTQHDELKDLVRISLHCIKDIIRRFLLY